MAHLKRLHAPKTWNIERKNRKFIVRPMPGGHAMERALPLLGVVRDLLHFVSTARELKTLLREKKVMVDGKVRTDASTGVGLFDVLSFPATGENYRIIMTRAGELWPVAISSDESAIKICKVIRKHTISGGKTQIGLHDGRTIISDAPLSVGDSILFRLSDLKIERVLGLEKGASICLIGGKHRGCYGKLNSISGQMITYEEEKLNDAKLETLKKYVMVVGKEKPIITINHDKN